MKSWSLEPVSAAFVTWIGPVVASTGTVAVIWVSELTVQVVAAVPPKSTSPPLAASAPVNPRPLMTTFVPAAFPFGRA